MGDNGHMIYVSTDARRVITSLDELGIVVDDSQSIWLELVCSYFFPNHILKVIDQVLTGGDAASKLLRARERGWQYFHKPCFNLLGKRDGAIRPGNSIPHATPSQIQEIWWDRCQRSLLVRDMDRGEADCILRELANFNPPIDSFRDAIRVCRERDTRSPRYLMGILKRADKEKQGKAIERDRKQLHEAAPWMPPVDYEHIARAEQARLAVEWEQGKSNIEIMKALREYGS